MWHVQFVGLTRNMDRNHLSLSLCASRATLSCNSSVPSRYLFANSLSCDTYQKIHFGSENVQLECAHCPSRPRFHLGPHRNIHTGGVKLPTGLRAIRAWWVEHPSQAASRRTVKRPEPLAGASALQSPLDFTRGHRRLRDASTSTSMSLGLCASDVLRCGERSGCCCNMQD